jgi:hypothetical protein
MSIKLTLNTSVGEGGKNADDDVQKVQDTLNAIPVTDGGPKTLLSLDGKAGPKTKNSIKEFQLRHFGWKLADARVDPNGRTWQRMCELLGVYGSTFWNIRRLEQRRRPDKPFRDTDSKDRFYEIQSADGRQRALYYFLTPDQHMSRGFELPFELDGLPEHNQFTTQVPCSVYAFAAIGAMHQELTNTPSDATINLRFTPRRTDLASAGLNLRIRHRWIVPSNTSENSRQLTGTLRFVKSLCRDVDQQKVPGHK